MIRTYNGGFDDRQGGCLRAALHKMDERFTIHAWDGPSSRPASIGPTGELYITMTNDGVHEEGSLKECFHSREADAVNAWIEEVFKYGEGKQNLYWREEPELHSAQHRQYNGEYYLNSSMYLIYSRLLISDARVLA